MCDKYMYLYNTIQCQYNVVSVLCVYKCTCMRHVDIDIQTYVMHIVKVL